MGPRESLRHIREELGQGFLERAELIDGALAALLSGHHLDELRAGQAEARAVAIPDPIYRALTDLRRELGRRQLVSSDRRYRQSKEKLGFHLFSVLIDVGPSSLGPLVEFSDQITSVRQLTSDATRDIFLKV